jgi:antitoxin YefM
MDEVDFPATPGSPTPVPASYSDVALGIILAYHEVMQTLPLSKVRDKLSEFVDAVSVTHEQVTITKNGAPAAVLIGSDEWESLQETLFWLSQPGIRESIAEAEADIEAGRTYGEAEVREQLGIAKRAR